MSAVAAVAPLPVGRLRRCGCDGVRCRSLTIRSYPGEASNALAGAALIGAGVRFLAEGEALLGVALIGAGVAGVGFGVGVDFLVEAEALFGLTIVGLGVVGVPSAWPTSASAWAFWSTGRPFWAWPSSASAWPGVEAT